MILLHIEHSVSSFDAWKTAFDGYEELRQKTHVRCYRILRPIDNPNYAVINLEFDRPGDAETLLSEVQKVWQRVGGTLIKDPQWRISEVVETKEYQPE